MDIKSDSSTYLFKKIMSLGLFLIRALTSDSNSPKPNITSLYVPFFLYFMNSSIHNNIPDS